jgi:hypothetical protein
MPDSLSYFRNFIISQDEYFFIPEHIVNANNTSKINLIVQKDIDTNTFARKSIFQYHCLKPVNPEPVVKLQKTESYLGLPIIILVLILASIVKYFYGRRFTMIIKSFTVNRFLNQLVREGNLFSEQITFPLFMIFLLNLSTFLWISTKNIFFKLDILNNDYILFGVIILIILLYYFFQIAGIYFLGYLFKKKQTSYQIIILLCNMVLGVILLPFMPFFIYNPNKILLYITFGILIVCLIWRILKIMHINLIEIKFADNYLFLFLYLCGIEIIPMTILVKLFVLTV